MHWFNVYKPTFVYSNVPNQTPSFNLTTREELEDIALNPTDTNFHFHAQVFKGFDLELFGLDLPIYNDWLLMGISVEDCYLSGGSPIGYEVSGGSGGTTPVNFPSYIICSDGCTDDLFAITNDAL